MLTLGIIYIFILDSIGAKGFKISAADIKEMRSGKKIEIIGISEPVIFLDFMMLWTILMPDMDVFEEYVDRIFLPSIIVGVILVTYGIALNKKQTEDASYKAPANVFKTMSVAQSLLVVSLISLLFSVMSRFLVEKNFAVRLTEILCYIQLFVSAGLFSVSVIIALVNLIKRIRNMIRIRRENIKKTRSENSDHRCCGTFFLYRFYDVAGIFDTGYGCDRRIYDVYFGNTVLCQRGIGHIRACIK